MRTVDSQQKRVLPEVAMNEFRNGYFGASRGVLVSEAGSTDVQLEVEPQSVQADARQPTEGPETNTNDGDSVAVGIDGPESVSDSETDHSDANSPQSSSRFAADAEQQPYDAARFEVNRLRIWIG